MLENETEYKWHHTQNLIEVIQRKMVTIDTTLAGASEKSMMEYRVESPDS